MIILRDKYYSDKINSENVDLKKERIKGAASLVGGAGSIALASSKIGNKFHGKAVGDIFWTRNDSPAAEEVKRKLIENARKKGITFVENEAGNSAYLGMPAGKLYRKVLGKYVTSAKTGEKRKARYEKADRIVRKLTRDVAGLSSIGKNRVSLGDFGTLSDVDVLAHELGHAEHVIKKGSGGKVGKVAHRMAGNYAAAPKYASMGLGAVSGYINEKNRQKGKNKKINKFNRYSDYVVPAAMTAGLLVSEAAASKKGLKLMKEAGANKEVMDLGKKRLRSAWNTYVTPATKGAAYYVGGSLVGSGAARLTQRKHTKDERLDNKKEK